MIDIGLDYVGGVGDQYEVNAILLDHRPAILVVESSAGGE
jgi:hypothetical protein